MKETILEQFETLQSSSHAQKNYFLSERKRSLKQLLLGLKHHEEDIIQSLAQDLGRPKFESYALEVALIKDEIKTALRSMHHWSRPKKVATPLIFQPGTSWIEYRPKGVVLIIAPWNYPFQLSLVPLISAIASGNCAIIKPSESAPHASLVIATLIKNFLDPDCFRVVLGGPEVSEELLELPFDHIFFTGGSAIGREVMKKASRHLVPVTLELGGKSPSIIDENGDLEIAAKRILWGKYINAGQTCIAPDYILIKATMVDTLIKILKKHLNIMFGDDARKSSSYGRIINQKHLMRLVNYLRDGKIVHGGNYDEGSLYFEPTIMIDMPKNADVMHEEIFGPILPIVTVDSINEAITFVNERPRPLALYIFSNHKQTIDKVINETQSGGVCINDCVSHAGIMGLPFGGISNSGMGNYHGEYGFLTFSHQRAIHKRSVHLDNPMKYPPYSDKKLKVVKMLL